MAPSRTLIGGGMTTQVFLLKSLMAGDGRLRFTGKISPNYSRYGKRATFKAGANARSDCGALTASSTGFYSGTNQCMMKPVRWCGGSELAPILKTASKKNYSA